MVSHYDAFLQNEEAPRARLSEALYWLAWANQQRGASDQAFPIYERALATYGDDIHSVEMESILRALQDLKNQSGRPRPYRKLRTPEHAGNSRGFFLLDPARD